MLGQCWLMVNQCASKMLIDVNRILTLAHEASKESHLRFGVVITACLWLYLVYIVAIEAMPSPGLIRGVPAVP